MHSIQYKGVAQCSHAQLLRVINLIEQYPTFLSWCKKASIHSRKPTTIQATLLISKYGFSFHCPLTYTLRSKNEIIAGLPSGGPFYSVSGIWRLHSMNNETAFSFELQLNYKKTWWINYVLIPMIKSEVKNMIKQFEQRARQ